MIVTANAVGLIGGSFLALRLRPAFPLLVATLATFGFPPPFFLLAGPAPVWLAAASMLVNGVAADVFEVLWMTALAEYIPGDKLSRVTSYDALGSFVLGPLGICWSARSAAIGIQRTLIAAGLLVAAQHLRAVRRVRPHAPAALPIPGPDPGASAG